VVLEIGVARGGSLRLWRDWFPRGSIVGLDLLAVEIDDPSGRIHVYRGAQEDYELLDRIARERAPGGFDIVLDDASHVGELTRRTFWHLFAHHLKPGGLYCIEDWGTAYWDDWPDGRRWSPPDDSPLGGAWNAHAPLAPGKRRIESHEFGLAGMVKELVDDVAAADATKAGPAAPAARVSRIAKLVIEPGLVVAVKRG
jgi:hypothetical protein